MDYYNKPVDSEVVKTTAIILGNTAINKGSMAMPTQQPINDEEVEKHQTLMPHSHSRKNGVESIQQKQPDIHSKPQAGNIGGAPKLGKSRLEEGMHSHFGHPDAHPIRMRHRKMSADPLHKEEDGLLDEWYDLYDKAKQGQCTAQELKRIEEIRGRIGEINSSRSTDAERILGIAMKAITGAQQHIAKAEENFQVKEKDLTGGDKSQPYFTKEAEYGDPVDDLDILPKNNGYKDQADHSESVWGTPKKDDRVFSAEPDVVKKEPKSFPIEKAWDDGRFSDPLFIAKYVSGLAKAITEGSSFLAKHDLPGSPHWAHMTNGGGWGVKLNPKTGNFVAYQTEDGAMKKREAQQEAVKRNSKNGKESADNDKLENDFDLDKINERIMQAIKPLDTRPLLKEPRMRP